MTSTRMTLFVKCEARLLSKYAGIKFQDGDVVYKAADCLVWMGGYKRNGGQVWNLRGVEDGDESVDPAYRAFDINHDFFGLIYEYNGTNPEGNSHVTFDIPNDSIGPDGEWIWSD